MFINVHYQLCYTYNMYMIFKVYYMIEYALCMYLLRYVLHLDFYTFDTCVEYTPVLHM